ncbi:hypothetical protein C0J09_14005 [Bordetella avium]|uniref:hypothetical protein n=1 Tax=Bordetella avium TaxID=521 RepID=UPI000FDBEBE5|nr:hypothetical protein [Bordetella avium]AZY50114.1 hypothetical protein C0J09_14005 [Bordetella avium]
MTNQAIPHGWRLVPAEMTLDMSIAFAEAWYSKSRAIDDHEMQDAYAAMLAAAPSPGADTEATVQLSGHPGEMDESLRFSAQRILDAAFHWAEQRQIGPAQAKSAWVGLERHVLMQLRSQRYDRASRPAVDAAVVRHENVSPADAVYGLMAWLTGREEPVTLSARHGAAIAADLAAAFCESNGLTRFSAAYPHNLKYPHAEASRPAESAQLPSPAVSAESVREIDTPSDPVEKSADHRQDDSPWFLWLERRFSSDVARRIISETIAHDRASRPAAPAVSAEPVAWFIDWPDEPELGHYLGENQCDGARNRALVFRDASAPPAADERASVGDERAAFEKRFRVLPGAWSVSGGGGYRDIWVETRWEGWKARAALASAHAGDCECTRKSKAVADSEAKL